MKCSVFTVCSPEYNIEETAKLLKELGYDGVEWRVGEPAGDKKPENYGYGNRYWVYNKSTLDLSKIESEALRAKAACDQYGLEVVSLSSNLPIHEVEKIEAVSKAAKSIGCKLVRVWSPSYNGTRHYNDILKEGIENLQKLIPIAEKYDIRFMIEIHMGTITPSASSAFRLAQSFDPKYIGFVLDPGNNVYEGYEPYKMGLELLGPYFAHVHMKNAKWHQGKSDEDGTENYYAEFSEVDKGYANLKELVKTLKEVGYEGYLSVEDFTNEMATVSKLRHNLQFMRNALK